jgi:hypothetical protein
MIFRKRNPMALHRDIYWLGRQWAVTGFGLQAIDQRLKGAFDIEGARLWEESALDALRAQPWLNAADLDKALAAARKRYPEPARKGLSPVEATLRLSEAILSQPARLPPQVLRLRAEGELAKFAPQWRIRQ